MDKMKTKVSDLAVFKGLSVFTEKLHVGRPNIVDRQRLFECLDKIFDNKWLTNNGPFVREFENKIASMVGVKHGIAMCNGTIALEIAIRALGLTGEVIVPAFTFIATAHSLKWQEITPVFCDVDPKTHNIDPRKIEQLITPRTTGIIGVHIWKPCEIHELTEIAKRHNIKILFDASHAFGCSYKGQMVGSFGEAEIFSFHATKFINSFEGGMILTNNDAFAGKVRLMKNFGFKGYDNVDHIGTNGKMNEACAAMGLTSLESMNKIIEINYRNYDQYQKEFESFPGVRLIKFNENEKNNYQYIVIEIDESFTRITRDQIMQILHSENILARRYFYPGCHLMEPYKSHYLYYKLLLPETDNLVKRVLQLPTGCSINLDDIRLICQIIKFSIEHSEEIIVKL